MAGTGDAYVFQTLEASGVADVAYSPDQTLLYAAMRNGDVNVYNVVTRQKIATWHVGTQLGGISVSTDGSFLLVTERQSASNVATFYRVNTATGAATAISTTGEAFGDVEIVDADTAILTGGSTQHLYNLETGQFFGNPPYFFPGASTLFVEDKHLTLLAYPGSSNGPLAVFDDRTNTIVAQGDNYQSISVTGSGSYTGFNWGSQAISEAAGLILQFVYYGAINVYDLNLNYIKPVWLGERMDGLVFDPSGKYVYAYLIDSGVLAKYDVATWTRVDQFSVGTSDWHNDIGHGSQLLINSDGTRITILDSDRDIGKLRIVDLTIRNERFEGTAGADPFAGGKGDDTYVVNHAGDAVTELAHEGVDTVETSLASYTLAANVERLTGTFASGQSLYGNASANVITGGTGDDFLQGGDGDDVIHGGDGNDLIRGEDGNDQLFGDAGGDNLRGGRGVDSFDGGDNDELLNDISTYGDRVSFFEQRATSGAVADLRTGIISNDGFGNVESMVNIESLGGDTAFIDTFYGNDNSNVLLGSRGDYLYGFGGEDGVYVSAAPALADGGGADDVLVLQAGGAWYLPDSNGDGLAELAPAMLVGWEVDLGSGYIADGYGNYGFITGFEAVIGSELDDTIFGDNGDNVLHGEGGADTLLGDPGNDTIDGGAGDDFVQGQDGDDDLFGGDGDDLLRGGTGVDYFDGGADQGAFNDDTGYGDRVSFFEQRATQGVVADLRTGIIANDGFGNAETMTGVESLGADTAYADILYGNDSVNFLYAGLGDGLYGFGGNDVLQVTAAAAVIDGGGGFDMLRLVSEVAGYRPDSNGDGNAEIAPLMTSGYTVNLAAGTIRDGYGNVGTVTGIEDLVGSLLGDDLRGDAGNNVIFGEAGNDVIRLHDGGIDSVFAGDGMDNIFFIGTLTGADLVDGGTGVDTLVLQGNYAGGLTLSSNIFAIENVSILGGNNINFGEPGTNRYDYVLTTSDVNFAAGVQARINGAALLEGEDFTFDGSAETKASFVVYGGKGKDTLLGGLGNDIFFYAEERFATGDTVNGGPGYDGMFLRGNYTIDFNAPGYTGLFTNIENLTLTSATDERYARGGGSEFDYNLTLSDAIVGAGQTLTVSGALLMATETMILDGSQETNGILRLFGGKAADTLKGGSGADYLHGNLGADTLSGGGGADLFRYDSTAESNLATMDQILDFTPGTDRFDLTRIDANTLVGGDQAFTWIGSGAFTSSAGQLRAYQNNGSWFVEGDTNGDGVADLVIALTLQGPTALGAGDFIL